MASTTSNSVTTVAPRPVRARRRPRRRWARRLLQALALVVTFTVVAVGIVYHDQIRRYATHWKGSPTSTVAWQPFPGTEQPALHLAVVGDIGDSGSRLDATAAAVDELDRRLPFDGLLVLGDNVYPAGDPSRLPATLFEPFAPVLDHAELLAILGNHDVKEGHAAAQVDALGMPGRWWARHVDDVLIIGLDSNQVDDPDQLAFLEDTLAAATEPWRIVMVHHPPYSAGYQGSNHAVRDAFGPLFERYGVQLVLSGHDHDYQRSNVINGVTYVVSGAAAGTRRTSTRDFTAASFSWHHFVEVALFDDHLVLRALNQDLRVADEAVIERDQGPATR